MDLSSAFPPAKCSTTRAGGRRLPRSLAPWQGSCRRRLPVGRHEVDPRRSPALLERSRRRHENESLLHNPENHYSCREHGSEGEGNAAARRQQATSPASVTEECPDPPSPCLFFGRKVAHVGDKQSAQTTPPFLSLIRFSIFRFDPDKVTIPETDAATPLPPAQKPLDHGDLLSCSAAPESPAPPGINDAAAAEGTSAARRSVADRSRTDCVLTGWSTGFRSARRGC